MLLWLGPQSCGMCADGIKVMASPSVCLISGNPYLQTLASYTWSYMGPVLLFSPSIRTSCAMSILSVTISTDTYDPDTGVGTVFNGKLRTIQTRHLKTGRGGMTSSASSVSDSDEHRLSTRRIACIHKPCQFQWLFKFKKSQNVTPNIHRYLKTV